MTDAVTNPGPGSTRSGGAWWRARASLARRRTRRFASRWSIVLGVLTIIALVVPFVGSPGPPVDGAALERLAADTLRGAQAIRSATTALAAAESVLAAERTRPVTATPRPIAELTLRIDEARRLRTANAFLDLAAHPAVGRGPRMRAFADSVRLLEATALVDTSPTAAAVRAQRLAQFGVSILAMARFRRDALLAEAGLDTTVEARGFAGADSVRSTVSLAARDTVRALAAAAGARDSLARRQRVQDSLAATIRAAVRETASAGSAASPTLIRLVPAIAMLVLLLGGLTLRFAVALRAETNSPTISDATEAERLSGARALTTVRDTLLDGPARFRPSGVDPFRMLYLGLTATGTRARTAIVTGPDLEIAAATCARLSIAAAADHRNTLVVDLDASVIALSRTFRERAEPGLRDVLARAFTWREVARKVGSSDGLPITLLPAGTERDDAVSGDARTALLADFQRLRSNYELTLAVAPLGDVELAMAMLPASPILITVVVGETRVADLDRAIREQRTAGRRVAGLVLWDAPRPALPTRAELAAELSKRRGRTPGGSFEAVQRVISGIDKDTKRP